MRVVLKPNESVDITFEGTDGVITVSFARGGMTVQVIADLPDSTGRVGVNYEENGDTDDDATDDNLL